MSIDAQAAFAPLGYGVMLVSVAVYWILLALPGYALLRRFLPAALEGGGLSGVALGYLASFALLTPVSVLAYVLRLPLATLSIAIVLAVLAALASLVRDRASLRLSRPSALAVVCSAIVGIDAVCGLRTGSNFGGDGRYHAARVRMLLDHGFNNWDPLIAGHRFDDVYHTNIYHALIAAGAQLTHIGAPAAWAYAWFFAKLACAAATYHLAWTVLGERWIAWIAAATFALWNASSSILAYPNMLAPCWLLALAIAFTVELLGTASSPWALFGLAATAVVLPQVHSLYFAFVCVVIGPVLAFTLWSVRRHADRRRITAAALVVLAVGSPWLGVTLWQRAHGAELEAHPPAARAHPAPIDPAHPPFDAALVDQARAHRNRGFVQVGAGMMMVDPARLIDPADAPLHLMLMLAIGFATRQRRRELAIVTGIAAVTIAFMYVPPLCALLAKAAGAQWAVKRLGAFVGALHVALCPGLLFFAVSRWFARSWLPFACLVVALGHAYVSGTDSKSWTRADYLKRAVTGKALFGALRGAARRRAMFDRNVTGLVTVVAGPQNNGPVVVDCDCYPFALGIDEPSRGVVDKEQRMADAMKLLDPASDANTRVALLEYYDLHYLYVRGYKNSMAIQKAYRPWLRKVDRYHKDWLLVVDAHKKRKAR